MIMHMSKVTHYNNDPGPLLHDDDAISSKISSAGLRRLYTESNALFISFM